MSELNNQSEPPKMTANDCDLAGRRRFVRGVGVIVPAVLTVGSRSALAQAGSCLSPSASASINLLHSRPDRPADGSCLGRTPGYWKNIGSSRNHSNSLARDTQFSSVFSGGFPGKTLEQVMKLNGDEDPQKLGAHLAAAWCNLQMGWVPPTILDLADLQAMWAGRIDGYAPIPGAPLWFAEEIVTYLKTTMTL